MFFCLPGWFGRALKASLCDIVLFLGPLNLAIRSLGQALLLYNRAPRRGLIVRDNQLSGRTSVNVILFGPALCRHPQAKKQKQTKCEIYGYAWVRSSHNAPHCYRDSDTPAKSDSEGALMFLKQGEEGVRRSPVQRLTRLQRAKKPKGDWGKSVRKYLQRLHAR